MSDLEERSDTPPWLFSSLFPVFVLSENRKLKLGNNKIERQIRCLDYRNNDEEEVILSE